MNTETRQTMNGKPVFTVPAKTIINYKSHFDKKLLCDGITFTAGSACVFSCSFCYVESMQKKQEEWFKKHGVEYPEDGHLGVVIRNENPVELARKQIMSKPEAFRMTKKVIYSSPKVDVAGNMELVRETVEICKVILANTNWDIRLLSKSNLLPKVAQGLEEWDIHNRGKARVIYGVSTGTLDDKVAGAFEEGTAKVSKRLESLHWLQDNGFRTFGMICPSLPQFGYHRFALDMHEAIRADKCEHVWAEVINLRGDSFTRTHNALMCSGLHDEAKAIERVSNSSDEWEQYARATFEAHAKLYEHGKLRFLQYVNKSNSEYWTAQQSNGAVLL
jgi:DNA repair photolyase